MANTIDRESPLVRDGFYNITVRAVDASKYFCRHFNTDKENIIFNNTQVVLSVLSSILPDGYLPNHLELVPSVTK